MDLFVKTPNAVVLTRNRERTAATNFSDSVLLFSKKGNPDDLHSILISSTTFFAKSLERCVPLRGGISYGSFRFNFEKSLFCGVPFIRAHEIAEPIQWSGIVIDDNVAEHYQKNPIKSGGEAVVIKWTLPIKKRNEISGEEIYALNWPLVCKDYFKVGLPISAQLYSNAFERLFKNSYKNWPNNIRAYYDNTVEFVNANLV